MPVYHIVLFRLKPGVTPEQLKSWEEACYAMVGKIPGLSSVKCGPPLPISIARAKDFNMGLVAVLETADHVHSYANHPAHIVGHNMRVELCEETLAYDLEFDAQQAKLVDGCD